MFDAVVDAFDVAEHHGGGAVEAEAVGDAHDFEPVVGVALERGDGVADFVDEDFAAAAGDGAESGVLEAADDFLERHAEDFGEVVELGGREAVDVDGGVVGADVVEEVEVCLLYTSRCV